MQRVIIPLELAVLYSYCPLTLGNIFKINFITVFVVVFISNFYFIFSFIFRNNLFIIEIIYITFVVQKCFRITVQFFRKKAAYIFCFTYSVDLKFSPNITLS